MFYSRNSLQTSFVTHWKPHFQPLFFQIDHSRTYCARKIKSAKKLHQQQVVLSSLIVVREGIYTIYGDEMERKEEYKVKECVSTLALLKPGQTTAGQLDMFAVSTGTATKSTLSSTNPEKGVVFCCIPFIYDDKNKKATLFIIFFPLLWQTANE
jgi:hypothetical protein